MLFNSFQFVIFFIVVTFFYYVIPRKVSWVFLLFSSLIFYMAWNPVFIVLLLFSCFVNYSISIKIHRLNNEKHRKNYLLLSLFINFGLLFIFKYLLFINHSLMALFNVLPFDLNYPFNEFNIILPMGISFYTFQAASVTIDVYKGRIVPEPNFFKFTLFITFFPQLVAGPIERCESLLPQLITRARFCLDNLVVGSQFLIVGFFKKVVIADRVAIIVNNIYNYPKGYEGLYFLLATILFAFQIYCDFSGYSDIAVGCAKILGIDLLINFEKPYFSKNTREFWRRWHVSLSTWFRDYFYIPLGGNKVSRPRWFFNIFITFLASGLWHGANWTFIIWGALHGVYQIVGYITFNIRKKIKMMLHLEGSFFMQCVSTIITVLLVFFAWIFFRANSVTDAFYIITNMFSDVYQWQKVSYLYEVARNLGVTLFEIVIIALSIALLLTVELSSKDRTIFESLNNRNVVVKWGVYYIFLILIFSWGVFGNASNFIYFQF